MAGILVGEGPGEEEGAEGLMPTGGVQIFYYSLSQPAKKNETKTCRKLVIHQILCIFHLNTNSTNL
ncbi:MAG: hypothetical protein IPI77_13440 [Saprospiraceae bacterium]|nr:hypothetical protein [Saprospiraceae bacterium]